MQKNQFSSTLFSCGLVIKMVAKTDGKKTGHFSGKLAAQNCTLCQPPLAFVEEAATNYLDLRPLSQPPPFIAPLRISGDRRFFDGGHFKEAAAGPPHPRALPPSITCLFGHAHSVVKNLLPYKLINITHNH